MTATALSAPVAGTDIRFTLLRPAGDAEAGWLAQVMLALDETALGEPRRRLGVFLRGSDGAPVAGVSAYSTRTDLFIHLVWVAPGWRGQGLGGILMGAVEHAAHARLYRRMYLNTVTFQAPGFYPKVGFSAEATLVDFVDGNDRHYFRKAVEARALPQAPPGLVLDVTDAPSDDDLKAVDDGMTTYWLEHLPPNEMVAAVAEDAEGRRIAAALGALDQGAFTFIDLWVEEEYRGQGIGRRLVEMLEDVARQGASRHVTVYPFDWQSPDFWRHLGYGTLFRRPDFAGGLGRSWMRKQLRADQ